MLFRNACCLSVVHSHVVAKKRPSEGNGRCREVHVTRHKCRLSVAQWLLGIMPTETCRKCRTLCSECCPQSSVPLIHIRKKELNAGLLPHVMFPPWLFVHHCHATQCPACSHCLLMGRRFYALPPPPCPLHWEQCSVRVVTHGNSSIGEQVSPAVFPAHRPHSPQQK